MSVLDDLGRRTWNGLRHLGGLERPPRSPTPATLVWRRDKVTLWRYDGASDPRRPPVLLVMSLVTRSSVFDLMPGASLVERLLAAGQDVYLVDWGVPDATEAENTVATYCDEYLPSLIARVASSSPTGDVVLFGYCLGGLLSALAVAGDPALPVRGLVLMATPVDFAELGPMSRILHQHRTRPADLLDETGNVPAASLRDGFRLTLPTTPLATVASLWDSLADRRALQAHQAFVDWSSDHIPFPGALLHELVEHTIRGDALVRGRMPVGDGTRDLADVRLPVLVVVAERDTLAPEASTRDLPGLLTGADVEVARFPVGHAGLLVGRQSVKGVVPRIVGWLDERRDPAPPA